MRDSYHTLFEHYLLVAINYTICKYKFKECLQEYKKIFYLISIYSIYKKAPVHAMYIIK
jgi:hypothetical protein